MTKENNHGGFQMPLLSYRFRVIFGGTPIYESQQVLTANVEKCSIDMKNKLFSITIRSTVQPGSFNVVSFVTTRNLPIYLEPMGGSADALCTIELDNCECLEHSIDFDYADSNPAKHNMVFEYTKLTELLPIDWGEELDEMDKERS